MEKRKKFVLEKSLDRKPVPIKLIKPANGVHTSKHYCLTLIPVSLLAGNMGSNSSIDFLLASSEVKFDVIYDLMSLSFNASIELNTGNKISEKCMPQSGRKGLRTVS